VTVNAPSRFCVWLLALLTAVLAIVASSAVVASASTYAGPETRVRAIAPALTTRVGLVDHVVAGRVGRATRAYDLFVSATGVATNSADDALRLGTRESWGNVNTLDDHFARHGGDFAASSADDYARQGSDFLQQPGTLTKIDADGVIRVYDPATNTFGAYNPNGSTRTFFTPKRGLDYWNDQPGVAP